jgi:hypothetical protein
MAIAGSGVNAMQMWIENDRLHETKSSCAGSLAVEDVEAAVDRLMAGEKLYVLLYGMTVPNVRAKVNERLGTVNKSENALMIDRVMDVSNFEQQIKSMLVFFVNEHHAKLLAGKIIGELMQTDIVDDEYVKSFELLSGRVSE